ncbi:MAG TPA: hypothetical protein VF028_01505 [Actinomycetota bacterium]|nr:hypothetical protein [Actinomycetota bacterium]
MDTDDFRPGGDHARTVVVTEDALSEPSGSAVVLETDAVLTMLPTVLGVTIFRLTLAPWVTEPRAHVTVPSAWVHEP